MTRNLILRNYIESKQYILANTFLAASMKHADGVSIAASDSFESQNEAACFFLYAALIKAVLLEYSLAQDFIAVAIRKGPGESIPAFHAYTTKLSMLISLLNGNVPPASDSASAETLKPYLELAQCFRHGEIHAFERTLELHAQTFQEDKTFLLASRIRHNVFQMALRRISKSYLRISLHEVAEKLELSSAEANDVHHIIMKAIRDGTITGTIDVERQDLVNHHVRHTYQTVEPMRALQLHADANSLFRQQIERALDAERRPTTGDDEAEEALRRKIADTNKELVKALEEGVDSDAEEWMD